MNEYERKKAIEEQQTARLNALKPKIESIMSEELPSGFYTFADVSTGSFGGPYMKIAMACSNKDKHVAGQKAQVVSLCLEADLELHPQVYGGNGGQCIHREPNKENTDEKFLAMKSVKVPFRRPNKDEEAVLKAVRRFCQAYLKTLRDNKAVLIDRHEIDYEKLLA